MRAGRRRIAFIGTAVPAYPEFLDRWRGYCRALRAAGLPLDEQLRLDGEPSEDSGQSAVGELARRGAEFDAIFAASDVTAIGAMHALQKLGRSIPGDVAVVGFDDIPAASLSSPPLTTVRQDTRAAGEALVDALIEAVEAGSAQSRLLPVELIVRESSSS